MFDPNNLTPMTSANSRVSYDMRYSEKTGKFTLSEAIYNDLNLNENGFKVFNDADGNIVFQVVPNTEAQIYGGKVSAENKSYTFSASGLVGKMVQDGVTTTWRAQRHLHQDTIYLTWETLATETDQAEAILETEQEPQLSI